MSRNGRQIIARESGHAIRAGQPQSLIGAIANVVDQVRGVVDPVANQPPD